MLFGLRYNIMTQKLSNAINMCIGGVVVFPAMPVIHRPTRTTIQFIF